MSKVLGTVGRVAGVVAAGALLVGAVATGNPALVGLAAKVASIATISSPAAVSCNMISRRPPMTAISLFEDGRNAYILSDTAMVDSSGNVVGFGSKTVMFSDVKLAIAINGRPIMQLLVDALARQVMLPLQQSFLAGIPAAFAYVMRQVNAVGPISALPGKNATRLWIAAYDMEAQRPRMYTVGNNHLATVDAPALVPGELTEVEGGYATPNYSPSALPFGYITNPRRDGRRIIASQRQHRFEGAGGHYGVGGHAELYTISAGGVTVEQIARWPDRVGKRIAHRAA